MKKRKKILLVTSLTGVFIISALVSYGLFIYKNIYVGGAQANTQVEVTLTPTPTPDPLAPRNILLLGYGGAGHDGGALTDTIILAHIVPKQNSITLISVPRDIWIPVQMKDGVEHFKINHSFAIGLDTWRYPNKLDKYQGISGAGTLAKEAVSTLTGLNVDHFVSVDFIGFKNIINKLEGVDIYVPYSFKDEYYPVKGLEDDTCGKDEAEMEALHATLSGQLLEQEFKCRFETLEFEKGLQTLDAETALKFVRSRHSEFYGGDFGRSLRQQALIKAVKDELLSLGGITKIIPILSNMSNNVQTDIDIKTATQLILDNYSGDDVEINSFALTTDNVLEEYIAPDGQYTLIPKEGPDKWQTIHDYIQEQLSEN